MLPLTVRSFAKLNWMLRVLGPRPDGYHDLETIFQTISLHDTLHFAPSTTLTLRCSDRSIPVDGRNLLTRAALLMIERFGAPPLDIFLDKKIPAGGGLGGGSANAATTLLTCARLCPTPPSMENLEAAALSLGSDVPFFLHGGSAYATGRGDELQQLEDRPGLPLLLLLPRHRISTPEAFATLKMIRGETGSTEMVREPLGRDRCVELLDHQPGNLVNDLEQPAFRIWPLLGELLARLQQTAPQWARMSGSGSTLAGAYANAEARDAAAEQLRPFCAVATCETITAAVALSDMH